MNILILPSWYPNKLSPFDGDFIQRHVKAISAFCQPYVIYVIKDENGVVTKDDTAEVTTANGFTEVITYYKPFKTGIKLVDKFISQSKYKKAYQSAIKKYISENGLPKVAHVHIAMKAGLIALWIKKKWKVPYIVTEQWAGYLPEADDRLEQKPFVFQRLFEKIFKNADAVTVVSDHLGKGIQKHFSFVKYSVVPNVVNTDIFFPVVKEKEPVTRFIHVSNMNYQKNAEAIIEALHIVKRSHPHFQLDLYGTFNEQLKKLVEKLALQNNVSFKGEVKHPVLVKALQQSDAMVFYSRFETFGCVIIEANACGIPVIASDIKVFHELIKENENGIFVQGENAEELAKALITFMSNENPFEKTKVAATATKYSYDRVGKQFVDLYEQLI